MRAVFVDDAPGVLEGLAQTMRRYRHEWDLVFVGGGEAALEALEEAPTDILVTDVQMPGMSGDTLLYFAKKLHPRVARIVLTGEADGAVAHQLARRAHACLPKPCPAAQIRATIDRTAHALSYLADQPTSAILGGAEDVGDPPALAARLEAVIMDKASSASAMADIIVQSPTVGARMLQLARSAFFGPPKPTLDVRDAVLHLGPEVVRTVYSSLCWGDPARPLWETATTLEAVRARQLRCARLSREIARDVLPELTEEAYLAGLLLDIGLEALDPGRGGYAPEGGPAPTDESHARLGAGLLGLWGFPEPVVDAVAHHHTPALASPPGFGLAGVVHVAQALVDDGAACDTAYLERSGVASRLPGWRELARSTEGTGT